MVLALQEVMNMAKWNISNYIYYKIAQYDISIKGNLTTAQDSFGKL